MFHILVIDDDKSTRLFLRAMLESNGYSVTTVTNGNEALEMIKKYDDADKVKPFVNGVLNAVLKAKREGGEG